jgi:hypothetical protein
MPESGGQQTHARSQRMPEIGGQPVHARNWGDLTRNWGGPNPKLGPLPNPRLGYRLVPYVISIAPISG